MPRYKVEWDCEWDPRKIAMMSREFRRFLSEARGVGNISDIVPALHGPAEDPGPVLINFYCNAKPGGNPCGETWKGLVFQACPRCHSRRFVHKGVLLDSEEELISQAE